MSRLSKTFKKVAPLVAPIQALTTALPISKLSGGKFDPMGLGQFDPMGLGRKPGPGNPYNPSDPAALKDTSGIDFLRDKKTFAINPGQYGFLRNPSKTFAGTYKGPNYGRSDALYGQLLSNIDAPSSVDQVQSGIDSDRMKQLLEGVDTDTASTVGSLKSDFLDRGLSGPGMASDIEGSALADARAKSLLARAGVRSDFATKELDRLKAREEAARQARLAGYSTTASQDAADNAVRAGGAQSDVNAQNTRDLTYADFLHGADQDSAAGQNLFANLLNSRDVAAFTGQNSLYDNAAERNAKYKKPSYLDSILRNINLGVTV
jgi:hypothetical protein